VLVGGAAGLAAGAILTRLPGAERATALQTVPSAARVYLDDLVGAELGVPGAGTYAIVSVGALERGGVPIVMAAPSGATFRLDVLRADPSEPHTGIGVRGQVAVYLRNGGDGATPTDEARGLGAMALASILAEHEDAPPAGLLTLGERTALDVT